MTVLDATFSGRVNARAQRMAAREIHLGRSVLAALAALLFAAGWAAGKVVSVLLRVVVGIGKACVWCAAAVAEGYATARQRAD